MDFIFDEYSNTLAVSVLSLNGISPGQIMSCLCIQYAHCTYVRTSTAVCIYNFVAICIRRKRMQDNIRIMYRLRAFS